MTTTMLVIVGLLCGVLGGGMFGWYAAQLWGRQRESVRRQHMRYLRQMVDGEGGQG